MPNSILFIRSFTPDFDGKFNKYQQALGIQGIDWSFLGWDRSGENFRSKYTDKCFLYPKKAPLGGGFKNVFNIVLWNIHIANFIIKHRKSIKTLHIIDFDSAIFAYPIGKFLKKQVIFDVYDKYTSMRKLPHFLKKIADTYESFMIKNADITILADSNRLKQHGIKSTPENLLILENVPSNIKLTESSTGRKSNDKNISINYFGVLEKNNRGLEDISKAVLNLPNYELHVTGYGELEAFFKSLSNNYPDKIKYYGPKNTLEGLSIAKNADIMLGLYYKHVPNHLFAAPNKYYEHLMLGKPLLTTTGTPPGIKIQEYGTGWAISEGSDNIERQLSSISLEDIQIKSSRARSLWESNYNNYFDEAYVALYTSKLEF